jgi:hypothetical protein
MVVGRQSHSVLLLAVLCSLHSLLVYSLVTRNIRLTLICNSE